MNKRLLAPFALLALLLTGCPHDEYIVELTPHGDSIERTLTFFCADGTDSNGAPNYQSFPTVELASINALYPSNGISHDGNRNIARGEFNRSLPDDVGGSGTYARLSNSLGSAGFYVERFRGASDIAGMTARQMESADKVTDLILDWSKMELGTRPGYEKLRQFLDVDFRGDLKNVGAYCWAGQVSANYQTNAAEEFSIRIGQFLVERGYLALNDLPVLFRSITENDNGPLTRLVQRLVARKMGVPDSQPLPASLNFLADPAAGKTSFEKYIATTDVYQAKLKQWEETLRQDTNAPRPEPSSVMGDAAEDMLAFDLKIFGNPSDHLAVRLSLPLPPTHTNGRWDESRKQVVWDADIHDRTNLTSLPVFCYATWAEPSESFQRQHFGKVALTGENLTGYCLWRTSLDAKRAGEWDALLETLQPGNQLTNAINSFRFSGEPPASGTNVISPSAFARELVTDALK
jgi:hypothetical protein